MDEAEFRYGALYCSTCRRTYYYRFHIVPGLEAPGIFRCPECNHELREVALNTFIDSTDETLSVVAQLDEERWDKEFGEAED
jgi:uncharacterized protein YbaR (Trm112 family)